MCRADPSYRYKEMIKELEDDMQDYLDLLEKQAGVLFGATLAIKTANETYCSIPILLQSIKR